jgi:hypothetical protein
VRVMNGHNCPGSGENPELLQDAFSLLMMALLHLSICIPF